jgi:hypothetical protein
VAYRVAHQYFRQSGRTRFHQPDFQKISVTRNYEGDSIREFRV